MTFTVEWWQIAIAVLYFAIGALLAFIVWFAQGMSAGMGNAFGYPEPERNMWASAAMLLLFWPLLLVYVLIAIAFGFCIDAYSDWVEKHKPKCSYKQRDCKSLSGGVCVCGLSK